MPNPEWLQAVLDLFEARTEPFMEISVADEIWKARRSQGDLDSASWAAYVAEHSAFMFFERAEEDSVWGTYFAPMIEGINAGGEKTAQPDVRQLNQGTIRHWEERACKTTNPILKARYADCIWDLEQRITGGRRQHKYAIVAAESYIEAAERNGFADEPRDVAASPTALSIGGVQMLTRAFKLARSINAADLAKVAASEMIDFCSRHLDPARAGIWLAPFDSLYDHKNLLTSEQENRIVSDLETMLRITSAPNSGRAFNPFGAQSAAERLSKHYKNAEDTKRLTLVYGSAFEHIARDASPMLALAWMRPLVERYQQVGLKSEAEQLALSADGKGKRIGEDLRSYSVEVPLDQKVIEEGINTLLAGAQFNLKLFRIGQAFTPSAIQVRESLNFARQNTPLLTLIRQDIVTLEGQTTARIGGIDDDVEGRLQRQTADHVGMLQSLLSHVLSELKLRDAPTAKQIVDALYECPLFSERRRGLITEGTAAYLEGDWVKAIHVLIPQMEETLRNLLAEIGVPVSKTVKNNPGVTDLKSMGDVLGDARIRTVLGDDVWRYLSVLYTDRRGINLRNQVAHGLVNHEGFNPYTADLVFHSFLSISIMRRS